MTKLFSGLRTLILCPHSDDEFGCAGTISRLIESGSEIHYIAFSRCEASVPDGLPKGILEEECRACLGSLGVDQENIQIWNFDVRHFPQHRQEILERMVVLNRNIRPELVLLPTSFDTHQDHSTIYSEGFRAFKSASILGYELPQNTISFENSAFIHLSAHQLERKIQALQEYKSQTHRPYASPDFIRSLAKVRGVQSGAEFAEAFEVIRLVVR